MVEGLLPFLENSHGLSLHISSAPPPLVLYCTIIDRHPLSSMKQPPLTAEQFCWLKVQPGPLWASLRPLRSPFKALAVTPVIQVVGRTEFHATEGLVAGILWLSVSLGWPFARGVSLPVLAFAPAFRTSGGMSSWSHPQAALTARLCVLGFSGFL